MKKLLLLVAAATIALGATAATPKLAQQAKKAVAAKQIKTQKVKIEKDVKLTSTGLVEKKTAETASAARRAKALVTPEGTAKAYSYSCVITFWGMLFQESGMVANVSTSEDGSKVYFDQMFPMTFAPGDAWVEGNVSTDGTSVTIPGDVVVAEIPWTDQDTGEEHVDICYVGELILGEPDEEGYSDIVGVKEVVFTKDGDSYFVEDDITALSRYIALYDIEPDGSIYAWDYVFMPSYEAVELPNEAFELPETAEPADFIYYYNDSYGDPIITKGLLYIDGNDVYANNLAVGAEGLWVKGTKEGDKVSFKSGQYIGTDGFYYYFYDCFYTDGTTDEDGYLLAQDADAYVLTYDAESGVYSNTDENYFSACVMADGAIYDYGYAFVVEPYLGDVPAVPSDPHDLYITDYIERYGQYRLGYTIDNVDVNGKYINPEKLAYYVYLDGEQYTLTPDVFVELTEDMDLIPYTFSDGYDISTGYIYIGEPLATTLGVQAVYTVDEVTNYSNVVNVDMEGNVTTEPAPQLNPDGISNVTAKQITSVAIYDAEGRKLDAAQKGVNVVKMVAADGSVKTVKMYKK